MFRNAEHLEPRTANLEPKKAPGYPTAPAITRYRCFLPDLAGLAGLRRVGPGTASFYHSHSSRHRQRDHPTNAVIPGEAAHQRSVAEGPPHCLCHSSSVRRPASNAEESASAFAVIPNEAHRANKERRHPERSCAAAQPRDPRICLSWPPIKIELVILL